MLLFPDIYVKSAYKIDYKTLYERGVRGIIFDIDNTLVMDNADSNTKSDNLIKSLEKMGFKVCILSNNDKARVERFMKNIKVDYTYHSRKPSPKGYIACMKKMGTDVNSTVFVGDQIFTDILGAKRAGIFAILCKKISPKEIIQIRIKRIIEVPVMALYKVKCLFSDKTEADFGRKKQ
jgi:HAD superfamily phosphatase (TIGR01668 family)